MFCSNCGAKLRDGAQFCSGCGKKIAVKPGASAAGTSGPSMIRPQGQAVPHQNPIVSGQDQSRKEQAAAVAGTWADSAGSSEKENKSGRSWVMALVLLILVLCGAGAGVLFYYISGIGESDPLKNSSGYESMEPEDEEMQGKESSEGEDEAGENSRSAEEGENAASAAKSAESAENTGAAETMAAAEPATFTVKRISQVNLSGKIRAGMLRDTAVASSYIVQTDSQIDNSAWSAFDGDNVTSWQEGVEGNGNGEYIGISFDREYQVEAITFLLGNHRRDDLYIRNNVPKTLTINLDGQLFEVTFPKEMLEQVVEFSKPVPASSIRVTIQDVYPGTEYTDTVIAEIEVYGQ